MSTRFYHSWSPLAKVGFNLAVASMVGFFFFFCLKKNYYVFALYEEGVCYLTEFIANSVKTILNLFGYHCYTFGKIISDTYFGSLILDRGCVGRTVMVVFSAFIIATPAEVKRKVLYILSGLAVIILLNVLRIIMLMLVLRYYPDWFDFTHEYLFKYFLYLGVFLLWVFWINKYRKPKS